MIKQNNENLYKEIEKLREQLNNFEKEKNFCSESILYTSQKLDELILQYYSA